MCICFFKVVSLWVLITMERIQLVALLYVLNHMQQTVWVEPWFVLMFQRLTACFCCFYVTWVSPPSISPALYFFFEYLLSAWMTSDWSLMQCCYCRDDSGRRPPSPDASGKASDWLLCWPFTQSWSEWSEGQRSPQLLNESSQRWVSELRSVGVEASLHSDVFSANTPSEESARPAIVHLSAVSWCQSGGIQTLQKCSYKQSSLQICESIRLTVALCLSVMPAVTQGGWVSG